jgi:hypothetical protein
MKKTGIGSFLFKVIQVILQFFDKQTHLVPVSNGMIDLYREGKQQPVSILKVFPP